MNICSEWLTCVMVRHSLSTRSIQMGPVRLPTFWDSGSASRPNCHTPRRENRRGWARVGDAKGESW